MTELYDQDEGKLTDKPWRTGRSVYRTIYNAHDELIGVMDSGDLAALVVAAVNACGGSNQWTIPPYDGGSDAT